LRGRLSTVKAKSGSKPAFFELKTVDFLLALILQSAVCGDAFLELFSGRIVRAPEINYKKEFLWKKPIYRNNQ